MLSKTELYQMGKFDKGGRYWLDPIYETETSRSIRTPSRRCPLSLWKQCQTKKYFNSLSETQRGLIGL